MSWVEKKNRSSKESKSFKPVLLVTVTYNRKDQVKQALESWVTNFDSALFDLVIVDNHSEDNTWDFLCHFAEEVPCCVVRLSKNFGTAPALNLGWRLRRPEQHAIKADSDIVVKTQGVLKHMIAVADRYPEIGILGLRRSDLIEHPDHPDPFYRSKFVGLAVGSTIYVLEFVHHVMGSFTLYNKAALPDFGYLYQFQDERDGPAYGYDDALACFRMRAIGKSVAYLRSWFSNHLNVIEIEHVDPGESTGDDFLCRYTRWKQEEARRTMDRYRELAKEFLDGTRSPYYYAAWDFMQLRGRVEEVIGGSEAFKTTILQMAC